MYKMYLCAYCYKRKIRCKKPYSTNVESFIQSMPSIPCTDVGPCILGSYHSYHDDIPKLVIPVKSTESVLKWQYFWHKSQQSTQLISLRLDYRRKFLLYTSRIIFCMSNNKISQSSSSSLSWTPSVGEPYVSM